MWRLLLSGGGPDSELVLVRVGPSEDEVYSAGVRLGTQQLPELGGTDLRALPRWPS